MVISKFVFKIAESYETYRPVGQTFITDLINPNTDVNINLGFNEEGETNITSWDDLLKITIGVDNVNTLNMGALMMDMDTGNIAWTEFDDFMVLGHEMVHAWRGINGLYLPSYDKDGEYRYGMARQEELQTTGLFYKAPGYTNPKSMHGLISENGLRLEYHKRKGNTKMKLRLEY